MRLDVFGRFQVEVRKEEGSWRVLRVGQGIASPLPVTIPSEYDDEATLRFLEDLWHESAIGDKRITRVSPPGASTDKG